MLGVVPTDTNKKKSYQNRQRSLLGYVLTDTALEFFNTADEAKVLNGFRADFLDRFNDGRYKLKHNLEVENASGQEIDLIKNIFSGTQLIRVGQKI